MLGILSVKYLEKNWGKNEDCIVLLWAMLAGIQT
jgi:hypothetical protein